VTPRIRSLGWQSVCVALAFALLLSLGYWQTKRLHWKEALIARVEARIGLAPVAPPPQSEWAALIPEDYDYRHVRLSGEFDLGHSALVYSQAPPGGGLEPGFLVLTPLRLDGGGVALVNRGFTPKSKAEQGAWKREPTGRITITGLMRAPQGRNMFTPEDNPARGEWYTADPVKIEAALGTEPGAPFMIQQDPAGDYAAKEAEGLLRAPIATPEIPNNHFAYAVTWFSLAAALAVIFAFYARARLKPV
jgi:surfeit locus 1 family protein